MKTFYFVIQIIVFISLTNGQKFRTVEEWPPKPVSLVFPDDDKDNIRGTGGIDYPILNSIPRTSFSCNGQMPGFYADQETDCQVFHLCNNNHKISFLCGNGTIFNQKLFTCSWWYNSTCQDSHKYYSLNSDLYKVKPKEDVQMITEKLETNNNNNNNDKKSVNRKLPRLPQKHKSQIPSRSTTEVVRKNFQRPIPQMPRQMPRRQPEIIIDPVIRHLVVESIEELEPQEERRQIESEQFESDQQMAENEEQK